MPVISSFYGILIKMYFGDHSPPYFHAEYAEYTAQVSIHNLGMLQGHLPPKALALVAKAVDGVPTAHCRKNWKILSEEGNGLFSKIEPLK